MFGLFTNKGKLMFRNALDMTPNATGEEFKKTQNRFFHNYIDEFTVIKRTKETLPYEVEALIRMRDGNIVSFDDLTYKEIDDILRHGGEIVHDYMINISYLIHTDHNIDGNTPKNLNYRQYINREILWLEDLIMEMKRVAKP